MFENSYYRQLIIEKINENVITENDWMTALNSVVCFVSMQGSKLPSTLAQVEEIDGEIINPPFVMEILNMQNQNNDLSIYEADFQVCIKKYPKSDSSFTIGLY